MSGVLNAFYVKKCGPVEKVFEFFGEDFDEEALRNNADQSRDADFIAISVSSDSDFRPFILLEESKEFGEAVGLQVVSFGDDIFRYEHWKDGLLVRRLFLDPQKGWEEIGGAPEQWEKKLFGDIPAIGRKPLTGNAEVILAEVYDYLNLPKIWPS